MGDVHAIGVEGPLEAVEDGVQRNAFLDGPVGVGLEPFEQLRFVEVVEGVHDFIREPHEAVNRMDGRPEFGSQQPDAEAERGAVRLGGQRTALPGDVVEQGFARVQQGLVDGHGRHFHTRLCLGHGRRFGLRVEYGWTGIHAGTEE